MTRPAHDTDSEGSLKSEDFRRSSNATHDVSTGDLTGVPCDDDDARNNATSYPKWMVGWPGCILSILDFVYFDQLRADDPFVVRLRKIVMGFAIVAYPLVLTYLLTNVGVEVSSGEALGAGQFLAFSAQLVYTSIWPIAFVVLRCSPDFDTDLLSDVWIFVTWLGVTLQTFAYPDYPNGDPLVQIFVVAAALRSKRAWLWILLSTLSWFIASYNAAMIIPSTGHQFAPQLTVPDPYLHTTLFQRVRGYLNSYGCWVIVFALSELQLREGARLAESAASSAELAAELASALSRYDTAAASARIAAAREGGGADEDVLASFDAIVANLNKYRPHLPNWMLPRAAGDEDADATASSAALDDSATTRSTRRSNRSTRASSAKSAALGTRRCAELNAASATATAAEFVPFRSRIVLGEFGFAVPSAEQIRAARPDIAPNGAAALAAMAAATSGFVDRVHALASEQGAAVHGFVGDLATVSWNAASKSAAPEAKAARFAARLRADAGHALVRAWGGLTHGYARVQLAGQPGRQQALTVSCEFAEAAEKVLRLAGAHAAFLADAGVYRGGSHAVQFRGVALADAVMATGALELPARPALTAAFAGHVAAAAGDPRQHERTVDDDAAAAETPSQQHSPRPPGTVPAAAGSGAADDEPQSDPPLFRSRRATSVGGEPSESATADVADDFASLAPYQAAREEDRPHCDRKSESRQLFRRPRRVRRGHLSGFAKAAFAVYEVCGEHTVGDDEWIYVLQQQADPARNPSAATCAVLDHLLEGHAAEAAALLRRIDVAESFPGSRAVAMLQATVDGASSAPEFVK